MICLESWRIRVVIQCNNGNYLRVDYPERQSYPQAYAKCDTTSIYQATIYLVAVSSTGNTNGQISFLDEKYGKYISNNDVVSTNGNLKYMSIDRNVATVDENFAPMPTTSTNGVYQFQSTKNGDTSGGRGLWQLLPNQNNQLTCDNTASNTGGDPNTYFTVYQIPTAQSAQNL